MREKCIQIKEKYPIVISIVLAAIWTILLIGVGIGVSLIPFISNSKSGYLSQLIVDVMGTGLGIFVIWFFKSSAVYKEKRYGLGQGFLIGLYLVIIGFYSLIVTTIMADKSKINPIWQIAIFAITMIFIGTCEEFLFRGVISNLLFNKYGKTIPGVWFAVIMTGVIFGCMHLFNALSPEVSFYSALIQGLVAGVLGMVLTAIYFRCRNIWVVVILHAFIDFAALFTSGVFGTNTLDGSIGTYSALQLFGILPYIIVLLVLLRKNKMKEILENNIAKSSEKEIIRLVIVIVIFFIVAIITFIVGFPAMVKNFQSAIPPIESFSGTYINQDMSEEVEVKTTGTYKITMSATEVSKGTLVDMIFVGEDNKVYGENLTDAGESEFDNINLPAGNYTCKMIMITSVEEYNQYIKDCGYTISEEDNSKFLKVFDNTSDGENSVKFSFELRL